jgi:hypothetical protein
MPSYLPEMILISTTLSCWAGYVLSILALIAFSTLSNYSFIYSTLAPFPLAKSLRSILAPAVAYKAMTIFL